MKRPTYCGRRRVSRCHPPAATFSTARYVLRRMTWTVTAIPRSYSPAKVSAGCLNWYAPTVARVDRNGTPKWMVHRGVDCRQVSMCGHADIFWDTPIDSTY